MSDDLDSPQQRRENFLTLFLTALGTCAVLVLLVLLTGGFFLYVVVGVALIGLIAGLHYLLWGQSFSRNTAGEREEEQLRARAEEEDWPLPETRRPPRD